MADTDRTLDIPDLGLCAYDGTTDCWRQVNGSGVITAEVLNQLHPALAAAEAYAYAWWTDWHGMAMAEEFANVGYGGRRSHG